MTEHAIKPDLLDLAVSVRDVKVFPGNARKHNLDSLAESLEVNGQYRPIIANRRTGHILKGNGTYRAATERLGWKQVAVSWVDVPANEEAKLVLVDNRSAELGWFNDALLVESLRDLDDLVGTGYDDADLDDLERSLGGSLLPPAPKEPGSNVKDAKDKYDKADLRSLVLVGSPEETDRLLADLDALKDGDEPKEDVVLRLVFYAVAAKKAKA